MKALLATLCALVLTGAASANVVVTGTGKVTYTPDLAHVHVGVSSDGKTAAEAWQRNGAVVKKLFEVLKGFGVEPRDRKTSGLNVQPRYVHPKGEEPRLVGYTVSYDLAVTVRKLADLGKVLDGLVENGANRNVGISFGCADPEKLLDEARLKAVTEACKKAELYVKGAGASLGQVLAISEGHSDARPMYRFEAAGKLADQGLPIATGEQELSVRVTLTYAINHGPRS
jgi:uncharacterized protein YggE